MTRPAALFDLDGTLVESGPGIIANIHHAMHHIGRALPETHDLNWVIGPPLHDIFARLLMDDDKALVQQAAGIYRDTYETVGLLATVLYPAILATLDDFRAGGWRLFVATSKPARLARRILTQLGAADRFEAIYGSVDDRALSEKPELIGYILTAQGLAPRHTVMIGDRSFDISSAHANEMRAIGALWGYGGQAEMEQAGADAVAERPEELLDMAAQLVNHR